MDGDSLVVRISSGELYAAQPRITSPAQTERDADLAALLPIDGEFFGVSLDPTSHFRQLLVFLDELSEPVPLIGGEILKAPFRRLRVAPFHRVTWELGTVTAGVFNQTPPLNNQVAALRLYRSPPTQSHLEFPSVAQYTQDLLTTGSLGAGIGQPLLYHVYAPGARSITFFAGSHGDSSTPLTPVSLRAVHPERPRSDTLLTSLGSSLFTTLVATINAGGGNTSTDASRIVSPGFVEYYVDAGPATTPGTYVLEVGLLVEYA